MGRTAELLAGVIGLWAIAGGQPAGAQTDMMAHVDLTSPKMSEAELSRDEVIAVLAAATPERPADLADKGLNVEEEVVDLFAGAHHQEPFVSINPNRLVPVLEDGDFRLTESAAILIYLAEKFDLPEYPADVRAQARVHEIMHWASFNFYRDWGYNLGYPQLFPHHKRPSEEGHRVAVEWGRDKSTFWLGVLDAYWLGDGTLPLAIAFAFMATSITFIGARSVEAGPMPNVSITTLGIIWIGLLGSFAMLILRLSTNSGSDLPGASNRGTDTLFLVGNVGPSAQVVKSLDRMGWKVPIVSHWGPAGGRFSELAGPNAKEVHFVQTYSFFGKQSPVGDRVLKALMAKYPDIKGPGDVTPAVGVANAYDAMHLVAAAIRNAGTLNGDAIRLGFYKIDKYEGLIKTYNKPFTPESHDAIGPQDYVWTQFIDNQILPVGMKK